MEIVKKEDILKHLNLDSFEQADVETMRLAAIGICARILRRPVTELNGESFTEGIPDDFKPTVNIAVKFICWQQYYNREDYNQNELDKIIASMFQKEREVKF